MAYKHFDVAIQLHFQTRSFVFDLKWCLGAIILHCQAILGRGRNWVNEMNCGLITSKQLVKIICIRIFSICIFHYTRPRTHYVKGIKRPMLQGIFLSESVIGRNYTQTNKHNALRHIALTKYKKSSIQHNALVGLVSIDEGVRGVEGGGGKSKVILTVWQ